MESEKSFLQRGNEIFINRNAFLVINQIIGLADFNELSKKLNEYQVNNDICVEKSNSNLYKLKRDFSMEKRAMVKTQNDLESSYKETKFQSLLYLLNISF